MAARTEPRSAAARLGRDRTRVITRAAGTADGARNGPRLERFEMPTRCCGARRCARAWRRPHDPAPGAMTPSELMAITSRARARGDPTQTVDGELRASRPSRGGRVRRDEADRQPAGGSRGAPGRRGAARPNRFPAGGRSDCGGADSGRADRDVAMTLAVTAQPQEAQRPAVSAQSIQARGWFGSTRIVLCWSARTPAGAGASRHVDAPGSARAGATGLEFRIRCTTACAGGAGTAAAGCRKWSGKRRAAGDVAERDRSLHGGLNHE